MPVPLRRAHLAACLALAIGLGAGPAAADAPAAEPPRIFLSWRQPWGYPGATEHLTVACDDSARTDTLYLTFESGREAEVFYGMYARLYVRPAAGDTLMPFWHFKRGTANTGGLWAWFDSDSALPVPQPWPAPGMGQPVYEQSAHAGRLDLIYAVPANAVGPIHADRRYCYARIVIHHRRLREAVGCEKPVCIEWSVAKLSFGGVGDVEAGPGGNRFVTWNSSGDGACTPHRRATPSRAWRPGAQADSIYRGIERVRQDE